MDIALSALEGKHVNVGVYVPRWTKSPRLGKCLGYRFDAEQGLLMVGSRRVAFMAPEQPGMALASR